MIQCFVMTTFSVFASENHQTPLAIVSVDDRSGG